MSTSTLGREERKPYYDAYLLQRRVLLGCTLSIAVAVVLWIVAIATDHWFIVSVENGVFIAESRRYFLWSHSGLWRVCRYTLIPVVFLNSTAARNFTIIGYTQEHNVITAREKIANESYIEDFIKDSNNLPDPITQIDNNFRRALFAHWIKNTTRFRNLKNDYTKIEQRQAVTSNVSSTKGRGEQVVLIDPTNVTALKDTIGALLSSVQLNGRNITIIVPHSLRNALFVDWEAKPDIAYLLPSFAQDMNIPAYITSNGTRYIIQPPVPPKKGRYGNEYEYKPFVKCTYHDLFPTDQEMSADPSIDDVMLDYTRTQASFACICLFIMVMGSIFSVYTFLNPRYMFKRLAGGIHFISSATCLVVIQVLIHSVQYEKDHLAFAFPKGANYSYGYGVYLAWFVFAINSFAFIMFMWYSKKKKGSKAPTEEMAMADEPINIGR